MKKTTASLLVSLDDIPDDFEPLVSGPIESEHGLDGPDFSRPYPTRVEDILLYFANLARNNSLREEICSIIDNCFSGISANTLGNASDDNTNIEQLLSDSVDTFTDQASELIDTALLDFFVSVIVHERISTIKNSETALPSEAIEYACEVARTLADLLCNPNGTTPGGASNEAALANILSVSFYIRDLPFTPIIGFHNNRLTFINCVRLDELFATIQFGALLIVKDGTAIRTCKNCGDYFIPTSRSDELYCGKKLPDGKTCKTIGYDVRIKNNSVLREYRKIYKTQNARKQRNAHRPQISERFDQWKVYAKNKLADCQAGKISLDMMIAQLSSTTWMDGIIQPREAADAVK